MITGLNLEETVDYSLKEDTDNPTVFKIGIIPSYLFAKISSEAKQGEIETAFKILQIAIKGWENFNIPFAKEKQMIFGREMDVVPLSLLESIPLKAISELSVKVMEINQLTDDERKNL